MSFSNSPFSLSHPRSCSLVVLTMAVLSWTFKLLSLLFKHLLLPWQTSSSWLNCLPWSVSVASVPLALCPNYCTNPLSCLCPVCNKKFWLQFSFWKLLITLQFFVICNNIIYNYVTSINTDMSICSFCVIFCMIINNYLFCTYHELHWYKISHLFCFVYITSAIMCRVSLYKALVSIYITGFVMINPVFDDLLIINKAATKINNVVASEKVQRLMCLPLISERKCTQNRWPFLRISVFIHRTTPEHYILG